MRYAHHPAGKPYQIYERHHASEQCNYGTPTRQDWKAHQRRDCCVQEHRRIKKNALKTSQERSATLSTQREDAYTAHGELLMEHRLLQKKIEEPEQRR